MRTTPLVGTKLWFGPRGSLGWGWSPVSWEGWVAAGLCTVAGLTSTVMLPERWQAVGGLGAAGLLVLAAILKGTTPGGGLEGESRDRRRNSLIRGGGDDTPDLNAISRNIDRRRSESGRDG